MAFSPDGQWLAVAYFVEASNRAGTDWDSWVTVWNLKTGRRQTLAKAHGPVAISADSRTMATNMCVPGQGRLGHPKLELVLWHMGEEEPFARPPLGNDDYVKEIADLAFHPDGRLLGLSAEEKRPTLSNAKFIPEAAYDRRLLAWSGDFAKPELLFAGLGQYSSEPTMMLHVGHPSRTESVLAVLPNKRYAILADRSLHDTGPPQQIAMPWALHDVRGVEHFALPSGPLRWAALSGHGKLAVIDSTPTKSGESPALPRVLPAGGGAVAFTADASQVAVADARGIVRIWETATGRLVRTLRLDDRPGHTVLAAAVQCSSAFGDPEANRKHLASFVERAAKAGASIVVLPETAVTGYLTPDLKRTWQVDRRRLSDGLEGADPSKVAETVPGPSTEFFSRLADRYGLYLTVPLLEVDRRTGRYYNTVVLLGPDGRTLIHYRKRNPWMWAEQGWVTPGDLGNPVVDTPFGRLGMLICFDIHEQAAVMADRKIDTLLYSIAWVEDEGSPWFAKNLPAIAKQHRFTIVAANWTVPPGMKPTWFGYGQSRVIGADGTILSGEGNPLQEAIFMAEIPCGRQE
jgi:predicted amidohydrolase